MLRTHAIAEIPEEPGVEVRIAGFVENVKEVGRVVFVWVRDRSGIAQLTLKSGQVDESLIRLARSLNTHDVIAATGRVPEKRAAKVGMELIPSSIEVLSRAERLPIDVTGTVQTQLDTRLDYRPIDLRNPPTLIEDLRLHQKSCRGETTYRRGYLAA